MKIQVIDWWLDVDKISAIGPVREYGIEDMKGNQWHFRVEFNNWEHIVWLKVATKEQIEEMHELLLRLWSE